MACTQVIEVMVEIGEWINDLIIGSMIFKNSCVNIRMEKEVARMTFGFLA